MDSYTKNPEKIQDMHLKINAEIYQYQVHATAGRTCLGPRLHRANEPLESSASIRGYWTSSGTRQAALDASTSAMDSWAIEVTRMAAGRDCTSS